ncbi:beta-galactosidase [Leifsonia sp. NPDC058230]|uniref:beta-galactosidase n=1 Tax=Leifsonia sp. NPDC058230 TaxID=3346391 RepID=UPI0036DA3839
MTIDITRPTPSPSAETTARWLPGTDRIAFGADYNPEQWPREVWEEDVRLMKEAGVNLVSIGIFSWALLEPKEGVFDFGWLDDVFELLTDAGIAIDLGTPTASPPAWFWQGYPQARPVTRSGVPLGFGSRGMASPSSPDYARAATRITTELARRYGRHPGLRLWHVHNEYGAPISECYSDDSVRAFRVWLAARYGSLDALNAAWGTAFWGQHYGEWDEIDAPRQTATAINPAQRLDFARFSDHALRECFRRERDILHELSPGIPVTTNFMASSCPAVDYWRWAREVDIVSNDHYLTAERSDRHIMLAMDADLARSLAGGEPWLLMEHSTSAVNWQPRNLAKTPGELRRNSMTHFARGADGIMFFQWRASRSGAEKFHSAMVPHGGPDTRVFREVTALGAELGGLSELLGSRVRNRVAILWDWESNWALELDWRPSADLSTRRQTETFYSRLWRDGVGVDFVHPSADLSAYDLVIAPGIYLVTRESADNLGRWVEGGGTLVVSYFTGIVDENDAVPAGASPGYLRELLGLRIPEYRPLRVDETVELSDGTHGRIWTDDIEIDDAEVVSHFVDGPSAGGAAVTRRVHGRGSAWYLSTEFGLDDLSAVLAGAYREARIVAETGDGSLETVVRHGDDAAYVIRINHGEEDVPLPDDGEVLVGAAGIVPAGSVRVSRLPVEGTGV